MSIGTFKKLFLLYRRRIIRHMDGTRKANPTHSSTFCWSRGAVDFYRKMKQLTAPVLNPACDAGHPECLIKAIWQIMVARFFKLYLESLGIVSCKPLTSKLQKVFLD